MKRVLIGGVILLLISTAFKPGKPAWNLFTHDGKAIKFGKMVRRIQNADVILFGEYHNNPIAHWLQLELSLDLLALRDTNLVLGAEMFETDNQLILDEYIQGLISTGRFEAEARLWPNYRTDYKPLVELARENKLRFIATNIPRRYASIVNQRGFDGLEELSEQAKELLPPLPVEYNPDLNAYKNMMEMGGMEGHINENFPKAQAIKDAAMAHFILMNWSMGKLFLHFNGAYHSDNYESIYWYLKNMDPELDVVTITTVSQQSVSKLDQKHEGKADYIICVDENMTSTH